jgi:hypothetical protein
MMHNVQVIGREFLIRNIKRHVFPAGRIATHRPRHLGIRSSQWLHSGGGMEVERYL